MCDRKLSARRWGAHFGGVERCGSPNCRQSQSRSLVKAAQAVVEVTFAHVVRGEIPVAERTASATWGLCTAYARATKQWTYLGLRAPPTVMRERKDYQGHSIVCQSACKHERVRGSPVVAEWARRGFAELLHMLVAEPSTRTCLETPSCLSACVRRSFLGGNTPRSELRTRAR